MIVTGDTNTSSSVLRLRTGGSNSDVGLLSSPPTNPYVVLRVGGENHYVKLVPPNDSTASKVRIRIGGITYALALPGVDYGNGTIDSHGAEFLYDDQYNNLYCASGFCAPLHSLNPADPLTITDDMVDLMVYTTVNDAWGDWLSIFTYYHEEDRDYYLSDICGIGTQILFHHSECKGTPNSYDGKWEIRKVVDVMPFSYTPDPEDGRFRINNYGAIRLDKAPDLDLENYYVQIQPFLMCRNLTLGIHKQEVWDPSIFDTIITEAEERVFSPPYSQKFHCGGLLTAKVNGTLTFDGGYVDARNKPPCGDNLFLFARNITATNGHEIDIRN